jgi:hypothetical protein
MHRIRIGLLVFLVTFGAAFNANAVTLASPDLTGSQYTSSDPLTTNAAALAIDALTRFTFFETVSLLTLEGTGGYLSQKALRSENKIRSQIFELSEPRSVTLLGIGILVVGFVWRRAFRRR